MLPENATYAGHAAGFPAPPMHAGWEVGRRKPRLTPAEVTPSFVITPAMRAWNQPAKAGRRQTDLTPSLDDARDGGFPLPWWKRAVDLGACLLGLPLLALCALVMLVLTRLFSRGPILYRQERVGYLGRRFRIYKFRTMKLGADCSVHQDYFRNLIHSNAPMIKLDSRGDSRLIPGAWMLRASGLDELPQLINVWRGEMSLVGPRPCLPAEFAHYEPWQRRRCDARPGLTGLWQVSGKNRTTFEQMIRLDVRYACEGSAWLDLKIMLLTVPCLLAQLREALRVRNSQSAPGL